MSVLTCVSMCVFAYSSVCVQVCAHMCECAHVCAHVFKCVFVCLCMCVCGVRPMPQVLPNARKSSTIEQYPWTKAFSY